MVAKSPTEHIRELAIEIRAITEREAALRDQFSDLKARDEKREKENAELRRELAEVRQENAVLKQQLQDHISQYQEVDRRRWGVFMLLIGAVLSLASGLIVTLVKK